jgi:hypothetical protein
MFLPYDLTKAAVEFIGYAARIAAHSKTGNLMPYIIQNVFILLGPALFAASIYMTLSRIIRAVGGEKHSILRPSLLTKTFVLGDVLSFFVQGGAAGLMVTGNNVKMGERIIVVGLFIQIVTFGLFAVTAGIFEYRLRWDPTNESLHAVAWKRSLHMLYGVSVLIMVRSIFRAIEYIAGQNGYLLNHEWTLFVFDSIPMFIVVVTFYVWYPSDIQPRQGLGSQGLEQDMEMNS